MAEPAAARSRGRQVASMTKAPPAPPSLQELRKEIDAIDEQVHNLLMQRGDIIDRLNVGEGCDDDAPDAFDGVER